MPPDADDIEQVPLLEDGAEGERIQMAEVGEAEGKDETVEAGELVPDQGNLPRKRRQPIRMLDSDGSIYELENIILPEGWGSDSDSEEEFCV